MNLPPTDEKELEILGVILKEVKRAEEIYPWWPFDVFHAAGILCGEAGETVHAARKYTYQGGNLKRVEEEAIQTAAMAIRLLKNINIHPMLILKPKLKICSNCGRDFTAPNCLCLDE